MKKNPIFLHLKRSISELLEIRKIKKSIKGDPLLEKYMCIMSEVHSRQEALETLRVTKKNLNYFRDYTRESFRSQVYFYIRTGKRELREGCSSYQGRPIFKRRRLLELYRIVKREVCDFFEMQKIKKEIKGDALLEKYMEVVPLIIGKKEAIEMLHTSRWNLKHSKKYTREYFRNDVFFFIRSGLKELEKRSG